MRSGVAPLKHLLKRHSRKLFGNFISVLLISFLEYLYSFVLSADENSYIEISAIQVLFLLL